MALIGKAFQQGTTVSQDNAVGSSQGLAIATFVHDSSDPSHHDVTLSEVRETARAEKTKTGPKAKFARRERRAPTQGVPMREEFFAKIGWTRFYFWACRPPSQPIYGLVPYL